MRLPWVPIPKTATGCSVLPLTRQEQPPGGWRDVLHGEHATRYPQHGGMHYLTDGRRKYVWYSQTGDELLFDLEQDPQERRNLADTSGAAGQLTTWRRRMVDALR